MDNNGKTIESCLKIFKLIKLLLEDSATFKDVVEVISDTQTSNSSNSSLHSVMLNKYLNTLKLFGLNVYKEKGKYHLINSPYKISLSAEELNIFNRIKECSSQFKDDNEDFQKFLKSLELRFSEETKFLNKKTETKTDFRFFYEKFSDKINICTKFCNDEYNVKLTYYDKDHKECQTIGKPCNLIFRTRSAKLQVIEQASKELLTVSIDKIIDIKQLPTKAQTNYTLGRVTVFGLRGRLAKNYKLRTWEKSSLINKDGWIVITNRDESEEELTERILKYGDLCRVFTPHSFRDKIKASIDKTLALYDN